MRGGARQGAGRRLMGNRKTISLSVSELTVRKANELRNHGVKVNDLFAEAVDSAFSKLKNTPLQE